ncbi:PAP2-like phosphatase [Chloropicon primus]|uniref:PAP2-like phosphatase n=2 Tax=Chloropicon primus TaxID=1764295 RepID=A0A5B8MLV9_9CHLO|nr:PAP2-like phosphatase [Chloropicon primus]UPR00727.1 PAP2-like phosphatase [Chloropicon primus]|eukprot:QDZ21516.1 PAP2-like phosphatase [Chloropicon primus]
MAMARGVARGLRGGETQWVGRCRRWDYDRKGTTALASGAALAKTRRLGNGNKNKNKDDHASSSSRRGGGHARTNSARGARTGWRGSVAARASPPVVLWSNPVFKAGFIGWVLAQVLKVATSYLTTRELSWRPLFDSGGMPSSHSSLCVAFTTAVAVIHGLGSSIFAACLGFSCIVMYDAANVRLQAGKHAQILNKVVEQSDWLDEGLRSFKLKEVLGHTKTQVFAGAFLGIAVGLLVR